MPAATADPRVEFERRYCYQALETAVARGDPEIIVRGPRGTGKTLMMCDFLYRLCYRFPGITQVWLRKNRSLMADSVLATFEDELLGLGHPLRAGRARDDRRGYDIGNGSRIILSSMDDPDRSKSMSADIFWVNECSQLSESDWEEIGAATRERVGISTFNLQVKIGDCNPSPLSHWTNKRCAELPAELYPRVLDDGSRMGEWLTPEMYAALAEWNLAPFDRKKHKSKMIVSCLADNPGYWSIDPWGLVAPGLKYVRDKLGMMSKNMRGRYLEGRPVAHEGAVFPNFDDRNQCLPFGIADWPVVVAFDPGRDHPCAVVFTAIAPDGQPIIIDEVYGAGLNLKQVAQRIKDKVNRHRYNVTDWLADPNGAFARRQEAQEGRSIAEQMAYDHGLNFRKWPPASGPAKVAQVEAVNAWIEAENHLQVFTTCPNVIMEFQSWMCKRNTDGSLPSGDDAYEDKNNHAMDCVCGTIASRPSVEKPTAGLMRKAS